MTTSTRSPRQRCRRGQASRLILARQMDHIVREIERDFIERKICELDVLGIDDVVIAIVANERRCPILAHGEFPDLEFFGGNALLMQLADRDGIQKPIGSAFVGQVLCTVCIGDVSVETVPIPVVAARELIEI